MTKLNKLTSDQWTQVHTARADWLNAGLSTEPADRNRAEAAVTEMYRLIGKPKPQYVWLDSPAAAGLAIWLFDGKQGGQLWDQLGDQLGDQLWDQLGDQLWDQLRDQLGDQLWDQLWDQLRDQLGDQLGDQLWDQLRDQLIPDSFWDNRFWGGQEASWIAHYQVPYQLGFVTYEPEQARRLDLWAEIARSMGWWWPYEGLCIMTERPSVVRTEPWAGREGMVRLHCSDGPSVQYRDGWEVHTWHGVRVPKDLIEGDGWTPEQILKESNQEVRRCAIERIGWDQFIDRAGLAQVGQAVPDPGNAGNSLALYDLPEQLFDEPVRVLLCTNGSVERDGTRRRFGLTVPAEINDPVAAGAWGYDMPVSEYRQLEVRR